MRKYLYTTLLLALLSQDVYKRQVLSRYYIKVAISQ